LRWSLAGRGCGDQKRFSSLPSSFASASALRCSLLLLLLILVEFFFLLVFFLVLFVGGFFKKKFIWFGLVGRGRREKEKRFDYGVVGCGGKAPSDTSAGIK
jgi:hypothetical protein